MYILTFFAFVAGIITILSPCILPILPVILASSATDSSNHRRPYGIVLGFVSSFTFFTLFLSTLVKYLGIPADLLRYFSLLVIGLFGFTLLIPGVQTLTETLFSRLANFLPITSARNGFSGGIGIGLSLGILWTPCVGPILASVISLAIASTVTLDAVVLTLSYSLGTAIPMYLIILGGGRALTHVPWLLRSTKIIQKIFGIIMILTALMIYYGYDRLFQTYVLNHFPQYGTGLTKVEDNSLVKQKLSKVSSHDIAPALILGGQWFNSDPLDLSKLRGKVVLIDFWTYTCINCQRTLPYLKSWYDKYKDQGLVLIGVHSPEFEFEKTASNVEHALRDFGITYPVMQDNDFATWRAYSNSYWPAKYLIDGDGKIRYSHFGEGDYNKTEEMIQSLLKEIGSSPSTGISNPAYRIYAHTPELYLGAKRYAANTPITYSGKWSKSAEYATQEPGSSLTLSFDAKAVYLVMRPIDQKANVEVYLDGKVVNTLTIDSDTLYPLVDLNSSGEHQLKLNFPDGKIELFAFTFG